MTFGKDLLDLLTSRFGVGVGVGFGLFLLFYFTQNRAARFGGWLRHIASVVGVALFRALTWLSRKRIEKRLRKLVKRSVDVPFITGKVRIDWVDKKTTVEGFFRNERFIVRLPTTAPQDSLIVDAAFLYISKAMLPTQKRYLSNAQRQAIDLYVTGLMLSAASVTLSDDFSARFATDFKPDELAYQYLREFERLHRYGLFEDVFLRELDFLGRKILPPLGGAVMSRDVDALVQLLGEVSRRPPGTDINLTLERRYVRCGLVLVGRKHNLEVGPGPWVSYINTQLSRRLIDSVYVFANDNSRRLVNGIVAEISDSYAKVRNSSADVLYAGQSQRRFLVELRTRRANFFTPDGDSELMAVLSRRTSVEDIVTSDSDGRVLGTVIARPSDGLAGRIQLDDPAFDVEVTFGSADLEPASAIDENDTVSLILAESSEGNYRGSSIRRVFAASIADHAVQQANGPQPSNGLRAVSSVNYGDVSTCVKRLLAASDVALPLAGVANELMAEFGPSLHTHWLGMGGLKPMLRRMNVGEVWTPKGTGGWLLDPARHLRPAVADLVVANGIRPAVVKRVCSLAGAPKLSSMELRVVFESVEAELAQADLNLRDISVVNELSKTVRDRCEDLGLPVPRSAISFILKGYRLSGATASIGRSTSADALAELYRDQLIFLCAKAGVELTARELVEVESWLTSGVPSGELQLESHIPQSASTVDVH